MRTGAGVIKYAYSNSIDCTVTTFDVSLCKFFFTMLRVQIFFLCPFGALQIFFLQILPNEPVITYYATAPSVHISKVRQHKQQEQQRPN